MMWYVMICINSITFNVVPWSRIVHILYMCALCIRSRASVLALVQPKDS